MSDVETKLQHGYVLLTVSFLLLILSSIFLLQSQHMILVAKSYADYQLENYSDHLQVVVSDVLEEFAKSSSGFAMLLASDENKEITVCLDAKFQLVENQNCDWVTINQNNPAKLTLQIHKTQFDFLPEKMDEFYRMDFLITANQLIKYVKYDDIVRKKVWYVSVFLPQANYQAYQINDISLSQLLEKMQFRRLQSL